MGVCEFLACIRIHGLPVECFIVPRSHDPGCALLSRDEEAGDTKWFIVQNMPQRLWREVEGCLCATVCMYRSPFGFDSSVDSSPSVLRQARRLSTIIDLPMPQRASYIPWPNSPNVIGCSDRLSRPERIQSMMQQSLLNRLANTPHRSDAWYHLVRRIQAVQQNLNLMDRFRSCRQCTLDKLCDEAAEWTQHGTWVGRNQLHVGSAERMHSAH